MIEVTLLENNLPDPAAEQQGLFEIHAIESPLVINVYEVDYYTTHRSGEYIMFVSNGQVHKYALGSVSLIKKKFTGPLKINRIEK